MKICNSVYRNITNFLDAGIKIGELFFRNLMITIILILFWIMFFIIGVLTLKVSNKKCFNCKFDDKISLGMAAAVFMISIIFISKNKFNPENFCLMNKKDRLCQNINTDCLSKTRPNSSIEGFNFGFGSFIKIQSDKGIRL